MKKNTTFVSFLLDETGSMQSIKGDTVGGFNAYVETLQKGGADIVFSLVSFNSNKTTPMPPWPSSARILYGPKVEPGASVMGGTIIAPQAARRSDQRDVIASAPWETHVVRARRTPGAPGGRFSFQRATRTTTPWAASLDPSRARMPRSPSCHAR